MENEFILTADWHLRPDCPRCRMEGEDWEDHQKNVLLEIFSYGLPVYVAGDIFHTSWVPLDFLSSIFKVLGKDKNSKQPIHFMAGNHDLPYHSLDNINRCAYGILRQFYQEIPGAFHYGIPPKDGEEIIFTHQLVWPAGSTIPPGAGGITASDLCKSLPSAQWIFTGDNHHSFVHEVREQILLNPGCITRQTAAMADYQCGVYQVNLRRKDYQFIPLKTESSAPALVTDYLVEEKEIDERMTAFVELLKSKESVSLSFRDNLKTRIEQSGISPEIKALILEMLENIRSTL